MINKEIQKDTLNVGSSVIGALVGFAVGGPVGAIVGATTSPTLTMTYNILNNVYERKKMRMSKVLERAFYMAKITPQQALISLENDESRSDDLFYLLRVVADIDPCIDSVLSSIIAENLKETLPVYRERLLVLVDAIKDMRAIHLRILMVISNAGGIISAEDLANNIGISVVELRSVVRSLELRGMILDIGKIPVEWKLRELGEELVNFLNK